MLVSTLQIKTVFHLHNTCCDFTRTKNFFKEKRRSQTHIPVLSLESIKGAGLSAGCGESENIIRQSNLLCTIQKHTLWRIEGHLN